jgi:hypothetical protein
VRYSDGHHAPVADKGWTDLGAEVMKAVTLLKTGGVDVDIDIDILNYTTEQSGIHDLSKHRFVSKNKSSIMVRVPAKEL